MLPWLATSLAVVVAGGPMSLTVAGPGGSAPAPQPGPAQPGPAEPGPERAALLDAARPAAEQAAGEPVRFVVRRLKVEGRWAFLLAAMQDAHGRPVSYRGTPRAEAAAEGLLSKDFAALLWFGDDGRWTVVTHADGPTDAAWADWPATYGAPASLVGR